jgi:CubicO group peptidase (beta-lactamase class C family)
MKLTAFLILTLSVLFSSAHPQVLKPKVPESVGFSSERLERLTNVFQTYIDEERLEGAVTLIARQGKTVYFKAIGRRDLESAEAMQKDSIFRIASQSKALISVGVVGCYPDPLILAASMRISMLKLRLS